MATRKMAAKKAAAKTPARKTAKVNNAKYAKVTLPAGFKAITTGDYGDVWEYEKNPILTGQVTSDVREVEAGKGKDKRIRRVTSVLSEDDGKTYTLWESASLKGFFDEVQKGYRVSVAFHGMRDVGRPQPMKVFEGAIAEEHLEGADESPVRRVAKKAAAKKTARR